MRAPLLALGLLLLLPAASAEDPVPDLWVCTPENAETCDLLNDPVDHVTDPPRPEPCKVGGQHWC